ncbi:hypothetical protein GSI_09898 [Ganoderma sinense ZZ0214-1]|uniref:Uncharacterized protein n=1 Tax=Ganoderma sinense ZZ0214-1 TaxID=1077348 RepID=A0A2G8S2H8_9APHY|nr:hypothetical protein GSI_09898 [Ganoderma sinense ZZ0214-1]
MSRQATSLTQFSSRRIQPPSVNSVENPVETGRGRRCSRWARRKTGGATHATQRKGSNEPPAVPSIAVNPPPSPPELPASCAILPVSQTSEIRQVGRIKARSTAVFLYAAPKLFRSRNQQTGEQS